MPSSEGAAEHFRPCTEQDHTMVWAGGDIKHHPVSHEPWQGHLPLGQTPTWPRALPGASLGIPSHPPRAQFLPVLCTKAPLCQGEAIPLVPVSWVCHSRHAGAAGGPWQRARALHQENRDV